MNNEKKNEIIMQLIATLTAMLQEESHSNNSLPDNNHKSEKIEFLTIKECSSVVQGINEHTIRKLVAQNRIKFLRCGQGKRGKILINKASLLDYLNNSCN